MRFIIHDPARDRDITPLLREFPDAEVLMANASEGVRKVGDSMTSRSPKNLFTTCFVPADHTGPFQQKHYDCFTKCFASWFYLMPDWNIRIISTANVLELGSDGHEAWVRERLAERNGIALSQWARLFWLWKMGGVHVDTDVKAIQRFDSLCDYEFTACSDGNGFLNNAIMSAAPNHPFVREQLDYLYDVPLEKPGDNPNTYGNASGPLLITELVRRHGWDGQNETATLSGGITVLKSSVAYPFGWNEAYTPECIKPETIAAHLWGSSWIHEKDLSAEYVDSTGVA